MQIATKGQAVTTRFTTERDTPHTYEQRLEMNSAYPRDFVTSASVPTPASRSVQPQELANSSIATTRSNRMDRELLGMGAQFDGIDVMHDRRSRFQSDPVLMCPYHSRILEKGSQGHTPGQGLGPMGRYLAEGPSDRHSMLEQRYHGGLDAMQNCRCPKTMQSDGRAPK